MVVFVFICYEPTTCLNFAVNLKESLRKINISGIVADKDLPKGEEWRENIDKAIVKSTYFVPLITMVALYSDEVRREIKFASELHKVIIPCRHRSVDRELTSRLPIVGKLQQIDFEKEEELANKVIIDILKREQKADKGLTINSEPMIGKKAHAYVKKVYNMFEDMEIKEIAVDELKRLGAREQLIKIASDPWVNDVIKKRAKDALKSI